MQKRILSLTLIASCALASAYAADTKRPEADPAMRLMAGIKTAAVSDGLMKQTLVADIEVLEADTAFKTNRAGELARIKATFESTFGQLPSTVKLNMTRLNDCTAARDGFQAQLGTCTNNLQTCTTTLGVCQADKGTCSTDLSTCQSERKQCRTDLGTKTTEFNACETKRKSLDGELTTCRNDLKSCEGRETTLKNEKQSLQDIYDALLETSTEFRELYAQFAMTTNVLRNTWFIDAGLSKDEKTKKAKELAQAYKEYESFRDAFKEALKKEKVSADIDPSDPSLETTIQSQLELHSEYLKD